MKTTKSLKTDLPGASLCKLAQVTTHITKIHGLHLWKDEKTLNKTYVGLTTVQVMARQAYTHKEDTKYKLDIARTMA